MKNFVSFSLFNKLFYLQVNNDQQNIISIIGKFSFQKFYVARKDVYL